MILAGSGIDRSADLQKVNGNHTGGRCKGEIMYPIFRSFAGANGKEFLLLDHNAISNGARSLNDYLEAETIGHIQ